MVLRAQLTILSIKMFNGLTPQANKRELSIERNINDHKRDQDLKDTMHKLRKYSLQWGIPVAITIVVVLYAIILIHNMLIGNWEYVTMRSEQFGIAVIGFVVGFINKKFIES